MQDERDSSDLNMEIKVLQAKFLRQPALHLPDSAKVSSIGMLLLTLTESKTLFISPDILWKLRHKYRHALTATFLYACRFMTGFQSVIHRDNFSDQPVEKTLPPNLV